MALLLKNHVYGKTIAIKSKQSLKIINNINTGGNERWEKNSNAKKRILFAKIVEI